MSTGTNKSPNGVGKLHPLYEYLESQPPTIERLTLSFEEIQSITGSELPTSAYRHPAWWSNGGHAYARAWLAAGWKTENVRANQKQRRMAFRRVSAKHPEKPSDVGIAPKAKSLSASFGKYQPLYDHLAKQSPDVTTVVLAFDELETLLKAALPRSARTYPAWWSNGSDMVQSWAWLHAGWKTDSISENQRRGQVAFVRTEERSRKEPASVEEPLPAHVAAVGTESSAAEQVPNGPRMYPEKMSPDAKSAAERRLHQALQNFLDDSYVVFHGVAWQALDDKKSPVDGEADFVIAHPERGILVVEVKGGAIGYDPTQDQWTSTDRRGDVHSIKDPFTQAKDNKYSLLHLLKTKMRNFRRHITIGHAVAFPDVVVGDQILRPDQSRHIVCDQRDMADLSRWIGQAMSYYRGSVPQRDCAPGEAVIQALTELLGRSWQLKPALWGQFASEQQKFIELTEQQFMILDMLNHQRRAAICGCAGSGKTLLAVEKASRLAGQGFRVLLTCFNKPLAEYLRSQLRPHVNLHIIHFHELCHDMAEAAGVLPRNDDDQTFFNEQLPEALFEAVGHLDVRYDAIIVDEGQDFQETWWIALESLLEDPDNGIFYIFFDDNQRVYVKQSALPINDLYELTYNCRNTNAIHNVTMQFYEGQLFPRPKGPDGRPVEIAEYEDDMQLVPTLHQVLCRLVDEEKIPASEIAVLTPFSRRKSKLWLTTSNAVQLTDTWPAPPNSIYCSTIHRFKGLERAVIVLAELDRWSTQWGDLAPLLYVACSCACNHLIVLMPKTVRSSLRVYFSQAL